MKYYLFVVGGVISGLGKGITTASVALLLEQSGYHVTILKADPYLNLDAGTMNPIVHGETFVTEDGLETDQDIGHYERYLSRNLKKHNYMTAGQVFMSVIKNERELKYNGECVEFVRHVPEEIIRRLELLGTETNAEIVIVEIGGTVGDIQNMLFLEAIRQLKLKDKNKVMVAHVVYLPLPKNIGELKTKPAQQSVSLLLSSGVQPDIIVTRSEKEVDELRKEKISIFCNVTKENIFSNPDLDSVYKVPDYLEQQKIVERIKSYFKLEDKMEVKKLKDDWSLFLKKDSEVKPSKAKIGIVAKYIESGEFSLEDSYLCVVESFKHAFTRLGKSAEIVWISTEEIKNKGEQIFTSLSGLVVPQGWGSRGVEEKIRAVKYARENKIPYLGLCFGMQMAVIEFARNVLGLKEANSTEVDSKTLYPVIDVMENQKRKIEQKQYGGTIRLGAWPAVVAKNSLLWQLYEKYQNPNYQLPTVQERHRHRYEFNQQYMAQFEENGMNICAKSPSGELVEAIELAGHPFFIGVQYHPELKSRPLAPHPIFLGFVEAVFKKSNII
jgi:CTP synthase